MTHEILRQALASAAPNKDAMLTDSSQTACSSLSGHGSITQ